MTRVSVAAARQEPGKPTIHPTPRVVLIGRRPWVSRHAICCRVTRTSRRRKFQIAPALLSHRRFASPNAPWLRYTMAAFRVAHRSVRLMAVYMEKHRSINDPMICEPVDCMKTVCPHRRATGSFCTALPPRLRGSNVGMHQIDG